MRSRKVLVVGAAVVLATVVPTTQSLANATVVSEASDAYEHFGFLDLRTAHVRVTAETVTVHLSTYRKWRSGWLQDCTDAFFAVGWPDDELQVDIDKRGDHLLRAIIRRTDRPDDVVGRVRAQHLHPRTLTFSFSTGKLQTADGKWFAVSSSPHDASCKGQWFLDRIPDDGFIVPN
jgi:hypothetical protein